MRNLSFYIVFMSGICLGSLLAYPIQETSRSRGDQQVYNVESSLGNGAAARPSKSVSRLNRLQGAYVNLVRAELGARIHKIQDQDDKDDLTVDSDYNTILSAALPSNSETFPGGSDTFSTLNSNDEHDDFGDSQRSKRHQQTWYMPYGKRNVNLLYSDNTYQHPFKNARDNNEEAVYNDKEAQGLLSSQLGNIKYTPMTDVTFLSGVLDDLKMGEDSKDRNGDVQRVDLDNVLRNNKRQAHQTWEIQYGKRNARDLVRNNKRQAQQAWEIQYGKRNVHEPYLNVL